MADNPIEGRKGERLVSLLDGRQVSNYSDEWREECEARAVCNLRGHWHTDKDGKRFHVSAKTVRRIYLRTVGEKRGTEARERLESLVRKIWAAEFSGNS